MTNAQIIMNQSIQLMKDGIIGTTGRILEYLDAEGNKQTMQEPEPIHTYRAWKEMGYQVRKGEKSVAQFVIWKHTGSKAEELPMEDGSAVKVQDKGRMFMKQASFFKASQVDRIEAGA